MTLPRTKGEAVLWFAETYGLIPDSLNLHDVETGEAITIDFKDKGNSVLLELKISFAWTTITTSHYLLHTASTDSMESNKDKPSLSGATPQNDQLPLKQRKYELLPDNEKTKVKNLVYILNR